MRRDRTIPRPDTVAMTSGEKTHNNTNSYNVLIVMIIMHTIIVLSPYIIIIMHIIIMIIMILIMII